ncbi:MAG: patatin-like phospholipase family protein [Gammaproteobacteria bacterium]|nr:patatin-like phospholipase family protein [Gammaproteobacteria bacterium]MYD75934.1 patatin-like phospholipase family protein [Gammaproteobacteria bacterium]
MERTEFFQSTRVAFQGGGIKSIAFIGAYRAALERGVNFSEVAGTSAGAIIAALIGAGATPDLLCEKAHTMDYAALLAPPSKGIGFKPDVYSLLATPFQVFRSSPLNCIVKFSRIVKYGGAYSSQRIEESINELLQEVLHIHQRTVRFKDLQIPTTIVAADITNGRKKVWSSVRTPDDSVAYAVRCSCSIPGFFQPVTEGIVRYVDGGILSSLPAFVYANDSFLSRQDRILAFRFAGDLSEGVESRIELFERVIDTVVDGAVDIQRNLIQGVYEVGIVVDSIRSTDFHALNSQRIKSLIDQGYKSTAKFFEREATIVANQHSALGRDLCRHDGDIYVNLVEHTRPNIEHVLIAKKDTRWFWQCFPTFLAWRLQGIPVTVLCGSDVDDSREKQRRHFLKKLGASVNEVSSFPLEGYLYMAQSVGSMLFLSLPQTDSGDAPHATVYRGVYDEDVIKLAFCRLISIAGVNTNPCRKRVELKRSDPSELIDRLRTGVSQYSGSSISITPASIDVAQVKVLNRYLRTHKYKQVHYLYGAYQRLELEPFETVSVYFERQVVSTMTPPIVEEHNGELVAIEGNTRIGYCVKNKITHLQALVVRGVTDQLPGAPQCPQKLIIDSTPRHGEQRIVGFSYEHFRTIERAARPL